VVGAVVMLISFSIATEGNTDINFLNQVSERLVPGGCKYRAGGKIGVRAA